MASFLADGDGIFGRERTVNCGITALEARRIVHHSWPIKELSVYGTLVSPPERVASASHGALRKSPAEPSEVLSQCPQLAKTWVPIAERAD